MRINFTGLWFPFLTIVRYPMITRAGPVAKAHMNMHLDQPENDPRPMLSSLKPLSSHQYLAFATISARKANKSQSLQLTYN